MFYLKLCFILVFSVEGLSGLSVDVTRGYTRSVHTEVSVSLLAGGSATESTTTTANDSEGTGEGEKLGEVTSGKEYEDPVADSSWICRFSSGDGGPCNSRADPHVPAGRYCLPGSCCSKTVVKEDQMGMWCTPDPIFCNGLVYYKEYSFDQCSCYKARQKCHKAAVCVDQLEPLRGVFCKCKPGYVGDGKKCTRDPCESGNPCGPNGKCVGTAQGEYTCTCGEGYIEAEKGGKAICRKETPCERDPEVCGPPEAVRECRPNGDDFACICKSGWKASPGLNNKCEPISIHSPCAGSPCGPEEAVLECIEEDDDSYTCSCTSGYSVEAINGKEVCRSLIGDPCENEPCGKESLVAACTSTGTGYTCTCKKGAKLKGTKEAPYCAEDLSALYAIAAVVCFFVVVVGIYHCYNWRHKRSAQGDNYDIYSLDYSYVAGSPESL